MATLIRAEISQKNKYWIDKHRHYELKHFCLQYPTWKKIYSSIGDITIGNNIMRSRNNSISDPTSKMAMKRLMYKNRIDLVEQAAREADPALYEYILKAVTEGLSFTYLRTKLQIPCGRDMYYDRYRKFFWILSGMRD